MQLKTVHGDILDRFSLERAPFTGTPAAHWPSHRPAPLAVMQSWRADEGSVAFASTNNIRTQQLMNRRQLSNVAKGSHRSLHDSPPKLKIWSGRSMHLISEKRNVPFLMNDVICLQPAALVRRRSHQHEWRLPQPDLMLVLRRAARVIK